VRTYSEDVRKRVLASIERVAKAEAIPAGAPRPPLVEVRLGTPAVFNDPVLTPPSSPFPARPACRSLRRTRLNGHPSVKLRLKLRFGRRPQNCWNYFVASDEIEGG
jgi:hypothetical protein